MNIIKWVTPAGPGRRGGVTHPRDLAFRVANHQSGRKGSQKLAGIIYVYSDTMKALRWQVGDRVLIGTSPDGRDIYIKRVAVGGFALSATGNGNKAKKIGSSSCSTVKTTQISFLSDAGIKPSDYIVTDDGTVMFSLPNGASK